MSNDISSDIKQPSDPALASVSGSARCQKCGKTVHEIKGFLHRMNAVGIQGVWECGPSCDANLSADERLLAAIEGPNNKLTDRPENL